jgi:hypothetical protein
MPTVATRTTLVAGYVPSVATIAARLFSRDGAYHVGERYLSSIGAAALVRHTAAVRLRADALRGTPRALRELRQLLHAVAGETRPGTPRPPRVLTVSSAVCPWCRRGFRPRDVAIPCGGRLMHDGCANALDVVLQAR